MDTKVARTLATASLFFCLVGSRAAMSGSSTYERAPDLIGQLQTYQVRPNESLLEIARRFDLGFNAIAAANPSVDPWTPPAGRLIDVPTAWILPDPPLRHGIVINLPELRLYYFPKQPFG